MTKTIRVVRSYLIVNSSDVRAPLRLCLFGPPGLRKWLYHGHIERLNKDGCCMYVAPSNGCSVSMRAAD